MEPAEQSSPSSDASDRDPIALAAEPRAGAGRSRRRRQRSSIGVRLGRQLGIGLVTGAIAVAPLALGGVHRPSLIILESATAVGMLLLLVSLLLTHTPLRLGIAVVLPLALLFVPIVQSIPIPFGPRAVFDPRGTELLRENDVLRATAWPLSLDPPSTRANIGRAAVALAAFIVACHLASSQRRRLLPRVIAASGIAAVVIGVGHRIFGLTHLYGIINAPGRALVTGPFVNSNHTSEFLELATFVCVACSLYRRTALNRVGWLVGAALCSAGALATLSRGAVAALAAGLLVFAVFRYLDPDVKSAGSRKRLALGIATFGLIVVGAMSLGAEQLVDRFNATSIGGDIRFALWRDGLGVLSAHPLGIGRGAFDRVFPVYRTLQTPFPLRFAFLENQPLQLLVDAGWVFFAIIVAAGGVVAWTLWRRGRRDRIEGALLAGLAAVLAHSLVDFGLETLGVALPFMAVLGTVVGRAGPTEGARLSQPLPSVLVSGIAIAAMVCGVAATAHSSNRDMDALLKRAPLAQRRDLLVEAQRAHPLDYFYALSYAQVEPLKGPSGTPSPRLHALNRALRLCPACESIHVEVATNLWRMGLRGQALLEWRSAVELQPSLLPVVLGKLFAAGAKPTELAAIAAYNPPRMVEVATFLMSMSRLSDAIVVLDQADAMGKAGHESRLARGWLELLSGQHAAAQATITALQAAGIQDPRLSILEVQTLVALKGAQSVDHALRVIEAAAARFPTDLAVAREWVRLIMTYEKWQSGPRAVEALKRALYALHGHLGEAHTVGARIHARTGRWSAALGEYRLALADEWNNVGLWLELGKTAEAAGRPTIAGDAYREASRLSPNNPDATRALKGLEEREQKLRSIFQPSEGVP
jgi:tetratricopeptide (TPR) repeat protein